MYEYKVVPAPVRATKVKGLKTTAQRFSHALAEHMNAEAAGGWQFQRTETLACEERSAMGRVKTTMQTVMVYARAVGAVRPDASAALAAAQEGEAQYYDDEAGYAEPQYAEPPHAEPHYAEPEYEEPAYEPAPQPAPQPVPQPRPQPSRQEPLFRSNPMSRPDMPTRAEPTLRPRAPHVDDEA